MRNYQRKSREIKILSREIKVLSREIKVKVEQENLIRNSLKKSKQIKVLTRKIKVLAREIKMKVEREERENLIRNRNSPKKSGEIKFLAGGIQVSAQHLNLSVSKARRVMDEIRGRSYNQTMEILFFKPPHKAFYLIGQLIMSAASKARYLYLREANSYIHKVEVNRGIIVKKLRPRAKGHSDPIKKTTCHVLIVLKEKLQ